ncbi:hypothetical protein FB451DRAFT_1533361 [Mycena latifolia]|nr:hypothetical protein FB451DRAFT_1533361 [Mycena latifolia]
MHSHCVPDAMRPSHAGVAPLETVAPNWLVLVEGGAIESVARAEVMGGARRGGSIRRRGSSTSWAPGLTTFGFDLGWSEIKLEPSTTDGRVFEPLMMAVPGILGDTVVRAFDGLQFAGRNTLCICVPRARSVVTPMGSGFLQGIGTAFSTGAPNALADGAILQSKTALHISIRSDMRALKPGPWSRVKAVSITFISVYGEILLVINVQNADIMTTLLLLKSEFELLTSMSLRTTFAGAPEAHLLPPRTAPRASASSLPPRARTPSPGTPAALFPARKRRHPRARRAIRVRRAQCHARFELAWAALDADGDLDDQPGQGAQAEGEDLVVYPGGGLFDLVSKWFWALF